jgi:hypothetical protein
MSYKLWPHQIEARKKIDECNHRCILSMEMGTGKTLTAIDTILSRKSDGMYVIVCPKAVLGVWRGELGKWSDGEIVGVELPGKTVAKAKVQIAVARASGKKVAMILNYEQFRLKRWKEFLIQHCAHQEIQGIIFDESHKLANHKSLQSKAGDDVSRCIRDTRKDAMILLMSGTVFSHSPLSLYGQMRCIDDTIFGIWGKFKRRYAILKMIPTVPVPIVEGYKNQDELLEIFGDHSYSCKCEDVQKDLPRMIVQDIPFALSKDETKHYHKLRVDFFTALNDSDDSSVTVDNVLVQGLRLQQVTSGFVTDDEGNDKVVGTSRKDVLEDLVGRIGNSNQHIVVFYRFECELNDISDVAESLDYRFTEVNGSSKSGLTDKGKMSLLNGSGDETPTLCAVQINSGSEGIDLTAARHAIFYRTGYQYSSYAQATKRLHRPGQMHTVYLHRLIAEDNKGKPTIDTEIVKTIASRDSFQKKSMINHLNGN